MSNMQLQSTKNLKAILESPKMQERLNEILGRRSSTFATSVIQIASQNSKLAQAEPNSIVGAALTAATLNLPLNNSLGYAYIIPFNEKQPDGTYLQKAQFQIGYKGFVQLALRSKQFKRIHATDVREGEIESRDRLTGDMEFNWIDDDKERNSKKVVGYVAYFSLVTGFEATLFMSMEELNAHAKRFSQTFKGGFGLWKDDFDSMAQKTVLKLLISKKAPLSIEMETAVTKDQASFNDAEDTEDITYVDNTPPKKTDPEEERILTLIKSAETQEDLDFVKPHAGEHHLELIKAKQKEINKKNKK